MKRNILAALLFAFAFSSGWIGACILLQKQFSTRQDLFRKQTLNEVKRWKESVKSIGKQSYGGSLIHRDDVQSDINAQRESFTPSKDTEFISLASSGGYSEGDRRLTLTGSGELISEFKGERQLISKIPSERRTALFRQVLTNGILEFSEGVLMLKMDILMPKEYSAILDAPATEIHIHIPELEIDKKIEMIGPEIELKNYPDIIEFELVVGIKNELLKLVPNDQPNWK